MRVKNETAFKKFKDALAARYGILVSPKDVPITFAKVFYRFYNHTIFC